MNLYAKVHYYFQCTDIQNPFSSKKTATIQSLASPIGRLRKNGGKRPGQLATSERNFILTNRISSSE